MKHAWRARKEAYLEHLAHANASTRRVSLADKLYTRGELLADVRREGEATWHRFAAGRADQLWYHRSILDRMRSAGQQGRLMEAYAAIVAELERIADDR